MASAQPTFLATRGSALALAQANTVLGLCRAAFPGRSFELKIIKTTGDKLQTASLASSELPKGLFTKEIEEALVRREADLAVHSLKDLPTELPAGLKLGAVLPRADVRDVLVVRGPGSGVPGSSPLDVLPRGATVATSSTRRRAQLLDLRPDLTMTQIRGNVGTRLRKLAEQPELAATVLAAAGLKRLGFTLETDGRLIAPPGGEVPATVRALPLEPEVMLPCVGQAAIGIEVRENDGAAADLCRALNHAETLQCVTAERAFLTGMGGGCQLAVAAYARIVGEQIWLRAVSFLGQKPVRAEMRGHVTDAEQLGRRLAAEVAGR
ncbi:MAG: hydroxymethylbilane synthase [Verrucomicrobia bacterium]|nr:hydroxymethylbilane synthase [Verrucomicrobiota bacterium]